MPPSPAGSRQTRRKGHRIHPVPPRVAYLGPAGTYTEEALRASAPGAIEEVPYPSIYEAVMAVQEGATDMAVVPIENSLEGAVTTTLDTLAIEAESVRIAKEFVLPVRHCLIARHEMPLERIQRVLSHPQATPQCARFLRERLPQAQRGVAGSTADAVRTVAEASEPWAAIGSKLAAELYGATVLVEGIEDHAGNETRFVWLARNGHEPLGEPTKTSIVFWGFSDVSPGALVDVLSELSSRDINLTKIESRPRRVGGLGHYMFFADLDGAAGDPHVNAALTALASRVRDMKVLGSYPADAA
jgi:prephenate dehydratase